MRLIGKVRLEDFKREHPDAGAQVESWEKEVEAAEWKKPQDVGARYPKADFPGKLQVIFDICCNKYRLWVKVTYEMGIVLVKGVGTHKEYDKWDIE